MEQSRKPRTKSGEPSSSTNLLSNKMKPRAKGKERKKLLKTVKVKSSGAHEGEEK